MTLKEEPILLFKEWFEQAKNIDAHEPTSMVLATSTKDAKPSARVLLLKHFDDRGFCFYTNLTSRKGKELAENPFASMCFYWDELDRQIRIQGTIERVSGKEADDYFSSRSRGSQIGAWASKQSLPMESREELTDRIEQITKQFADQDIPRPPFWGGFRLIAQEIEFWEKKEFRLHQRIVYQKHGSDWNKSIFYP